MSPRTPNRAATTFMPREHGATAMLLTPLIAATILVRQWHWSEIAAIFAALAALAAKDPLVVLARQQFVWKNRHPETADALKWLAGWSGILILSGIALVFVWPLPALIALGVGSIAFSALAVTINVKNKQRSTLFQIVSAAALTSTAVAACLSATGSVAPWCWWLWLLMTLQAAAGILVVHARLDARIAARKNMDADQTYRRAAFASIAIMASSAIGAGIVGRWWIVLALLVAAGGYLYDLIGQRNPVDLQLPLKTVGQRALVLSSVYAVLLIAGLW